MLKKLGRGGRFKAVLCLLGIVFTAEWGLLGCATTDNIQQPTDQAVAIEEQMAVPEGKLITGISIEETAEAIIVCITANQELDYILSEPPLEQAKAVYFPDSALDLQKEEYYLDNELIGTIRAIELWKGVASQIIIPIKSPGLACEAHWKNNDNILQLVFPRIGSGQPGVEETRAEKIIAEEAPVTVEKESTPDKPPVVATRLEKIDVRDEGDQVIVKIKADGTIKATKSFTLKNPSRIVLDLSGLISPFENEQRLAVNSDLVQDIRYCGHQGYIRIVLDVDQSVLSDFKVASVPDGLMVYVGNTTGLTLTRLKR